MKLSIKKRIHFSFLLLVSLFVINGIIAIVTLNRMQRLSTRVSAVVDPSLNALGDLKKMMVDSKMYTTNWVFLRSKQEDKDLLIALHDSGYNALRERIQSFSRQWVSQDQKVMIEKVFGEFEALMGIEKEIMGSLQKFSDYDDPVIKLESDIIV